MLTIIDNKKLQTIVGLSGQAIRDFFSHADPAKFKGEAHDGHYFFPIQSCRFFRCQIDRLWR